MVHCRERRSLGARRQSTRSTSATVARGVTRTSVRALRMGGFEPARFGWLAGATQRELAHLCAPETREAIRRPARPRNRYQQVANTPANIPYHASSYHLLPSTRTRLRAPIPLLHVHPRDPKNWDRFPIDMFPARGPPPDRGPGVPQGSPSGPLLCCLFGDCKIRLQANTMNAVT